MSYIAKLKERVLEAEAERDYYRSLVETFETGDIPDQASFQHLVMATWGRKRLEEKKKRPALLQSD